LPKLRARPPDRRTFTLKLTADSAAAAINELVVKDVTGVFTVLDVDTGVPIKAGTPLATVPPTVNAYYPDETSFVRVSHALWTWLVALAGGIMGRWLWGPATSAAARSSPGSEPG
jgi:hypothetical protein